MNLSELFERMPLVLRQRLEAEEAYAPWIARGERLENLLITPAVMETIWNRMTKSERSVFTAIIRCIGCEPFDEAKLEKLSAGRLSGAEIRMGFNSLLRLGLIYSFRKSWGEQVFVMPYELLSAWQQILLPELTDRHLPMAEEEQPAYNSPTDLAQELFHTLVFAAKNGLKLTKQGTLHKKQIQKLDERLRLEESLLTGNGIKYAFSDVYPLRLAIVFDLLLRLELLITKEEEWAVHRETLTFWLFMGRDEQNHALYKLWRGLTLPVQSWMQHAAVMLERYGHGEGIHIAALLRLLEEGGVLTPADSEDEEHKRKLELQEQWLNPLLALGWLDRNESGRYAWRFTRDTTDEAEEGCFIVQPDFEILVPPDVPGAVCWELSCIAALISSDLVSIYKLSKESLRHALENERTAEEIEAFLSGYSMYEVPDNVLATLREWMKPYGQTVFTQAVLLRCADVDTARAIAKLSGAAGYLEEQVGDKDFIVRQDAVKTLYDILDKAGYMPGKPMDDTIPEGGRYPKLSTELGIAALKACSTEPGGASKGLIYSRSSIAYFEMETRIPEPSHLYPGMHDIPVGWLKDYRAYHPSTRRDMVEQAIRLRTLLQIRKDGSDYRVAPRKLQETRGTWCMTAWEQAEEHFQTIGVPAPEIRWLADEWQEMKLILPGINDKY